MGYFDVYRKYSHIYHPALNKIKNLSKERYTMCFSSKIRTRQQQISQEQKYFEIEIRKKKELGILLLEQI